MAQSLDLTQLINTVIFGLLSIAGTVFMAWLSSHMKDQQAAAVISNAVKNSIGAIQQAANDSVNAWNPTIRIRGVPDNLAPGVQYVLNHAGEELKRFTDINSVMIAQKIEAQIGLKNVDTNIAVAASPIPLVPNPMAKLPTPDPVMAPIVTRSTL